MTSTTSTAGGLTQISGLASGIDTSSLISSLMAVAAAPQTLLKNKLGTLNTKVTALQSINAQASSLATAANTFSQATTWMATKATSSSSNVTTTTSGTPSAGTAITFDVTQLAAAHSVASGLITDPGNGSTPSFTITDSSGGQTSVTASSWDAASIATAVNNSDSALTATVIHSSDGDRLLMTSKTTGAASTFTVSGLSTTTLTKGANATLSLGGGTTVTSPSNTFTNLVSGVNVTVGKVETGDTVSVAQDTSSVTSSMTSLMSSLNTLLSNIATQTKAVPSTTSGDASTGSGPLVGDSTVSSVSQQLLNAIAGFTGSGGADTSATLGVQVQSDGTVSFDSDTFNALLSSDPARAQSLVTSLSSQLSSVATNASDAYSGSISREITSDQSDGSDLTDQISDWDTRLAIRQQTLTDQYTAMETAMSTLSSQGSALTSMINSL